jgi:hypothetical protein
MDVRDFGGVSGGRGLTAECVSVMMVGGTGDWFAQVLDALLQPGALIGGNTTSPVDVAVSHRVECTNRLLRGREPETVSE